MMTELAASGHALRGLNFRCPKKPASSVSGNRASDEGLEGILLRPTPVAPAI